MTGEQLNENDDAELAKLRLQNQELESNLREALASANQRAIKAELKAEAIKAGMFDLDGLKLIEPVDLSVDDLGNVSGAATVISRIKRQKPWLFGQKSSSSTASAPEHTAGRTKLATEMTLEEWRAARADLIRRR